MDASLGSLRQRRRGPTFAELYTPKLVTLLKEGYGLKDLRADAVAGLTVAIVALPLSMAIAIASGVGPERGLFTAIVGGFLVSALGGSRFQIGGPAGAFIVLIAAIVERHGYDGLVLATLVAGLILIAAGLLRFGTYIKYIPFPVTVGFTAAIAVIIFVSQLKELFGLDLPSEPADFVPKLNALWDARATVNLEAMGVGAFALAVIMGLRRWRPAWPGFLLAVIAAAVTAWALNLDVATISSRFGQLSRSLSEPTLPTFSLAKFQAVLPDAMTIALLGAIESLLSAVVADGMSGRRHRSNCELVAQGVANVGSVAFGGIPVTGTIARTATNVRAGAKGPISGILHAGYLLLFMIVAAPLAGYIPLSALGAVLVVVAWNMAEREDFAVLLRASAGDRLILLSTFFLTVFVDLMTGIAVGVVLGAFIFLHRMAESVQVEGQGQLIAEDRADDYQGRTTYDPAAASDRDLIVYRISGAFFFGAVGTVSAVLERIGQLPRVLILDFSEVPMVDSTAAQTLRRFAEKLTKIGTAVFLTGSSPGVRRSLLQVGLKKPLVRYAKSVEQALAHVRSTRSADL
jgi:sulfate permease, SulP family